MTPIRAIQISPAKANDLFSRIADTTPGAVKTREALFADLKAELELIAQLERDHLLPVLRKHAGTKAMAPAISDRLNAMKSLLLKLEKAPKEGTDFPGQVAELKKLFQAHLRDEKNELLPAIKKALSDEEVEALAEQVEARKAEVAKAEKETDDKRRADARRAREQEEARQAAIEAAARAEKKAATDAARRVREQEEARQAAVEAAARAEKKAAAEAARAVREAAEAARARADEAQAAMRSGLDAAANVTQQAAGEMAEVMRAASDTTRRTMTAAQAGPILFRGYQDASREWMGWAQGRMQRRVEAVTALMRCRTPSELMAAQSQLVRDEVEQWLETNSRVHNLAATAAGDAATAVTR